MLTPEQAVVAAILVCLGGAVLTCSRRAPQTAGRLARLPRRGHFGGADLHRASGQVLRTALAASASSGPCRSIGFALRLHVDGLTAVFLLLAALHRRARLLLFHHLHGHYADYGVARYYPYFLLFLAAMYGLLSTTDMMWFFFMFWQMMTLPGYALIRFEYRKPENVRAANKFLLMMQIACAATHDRRGNAGRQPARRVGERELRYDFDTVSANLPALLSDAPGA